MDLSLAEAARLLGKSERQLSYAIKKGEIPAKVAGGRYAIRREDLPLSEGQEAAQRQKAQRAVDMATEVLRPAPAGGDRPRYSIRDLRAVKDGIGLYADVVAASGATSEPAMHVRQSLMHVACGGHAYHRREKAEAFHRARESASMAVMALLLDGGEAGSSLAGRVEETILPAISGLLRHVERKGS